MTCAAKATGGGAPSGALVGVHEARGDATDSGSGSVGSRADVRVGSVTAVTATVPAGGIRSRY